MQHTPPRPAQASPAPWHVQQGPGRFPHIADADGDLVALVVGAPFVAEAQALVNARQMAIAPELIERLGDLLKDVDYLTLDDPTHYAVANTVALSALRARQLLERLRGTPP